ncbi:hypothetical protein AB5N19_13160 [Seiridium cardinale]
MSRSMRHWFSSESSRAHDDTSDQKEESIASEGELPSEKHNETSTLSHTNPFRGFKDNSDIHGAHGNSYERESHGASSLGPGDHRSPWDRLKEFHTIFLVDDSASMKADWAQALSFLRDVIPHCLKYAGRDVSIFFTNHWTAEPSRYEQEWTPEWPVPSGYHNVRCVTQEEATALGYPQEASAEFIFDRVAPVEERADASTRMARRLGPILRPYIAAYKAGTAGDERFKHIANANLIVVTNGANHEDVGTETQAIAEDLNECGAPSTQVGIQFVQIGSDKESSALLKQLDSDIVLNDRDMIDTVLYEQTRDRKTGRMTEDGLFKVLLGAMSRRVDMKRLENGHFIGRP